MLSHKMHEAWTDSRRSRSKKSNDGRELETLALSVREQIVKMYKAIIQYQISLARHYEHPGLLRFLEDFATPRGWAGMLQEIKDIEKSVTQHLSIMNTSTLVQIDKTLERLQAKVEDSYEVMNEVRGNTQTHKYRQFAQILAPKIAPQARFECFESQYKTACFEGTHVDVLGQIYAWVVSPGPEHIYWLRGIAGTGKSTISRTIATQCLNCLGGTFFFDQNQGELSTAPYLFPTLLRFARRLRIVYRISDRKPAKSIKTIEHLVRVAQQAAEALDSRAFLETGGAKPTSSIDSGCGHRWA
ncbi:hypothetical protein BO82DRAFT_57330 [Aspergillus uvarum CBS 121591]|uniref:Uncharacterized protein n=1 Tax=Aspergillus uvarum CBS 121591 TaxID=1448315 RepID=A0A319CCB7_9EURO|nr:hypothetical protein BO82DRAFT_57330 [Aspergillus uvarum CBS 121591]PYH82814.1 hypothetical protein BO82DRAFT_57330 [Aspergillus uvarum CBS 121591]